MVTAASPTKRFVIDILRNCTAKCRFCYHLHSYDRWPDQTMSLDRVKSEIDDGLKRGNNYMDITGGEPTIYSGIEEIITYALNKEIRTCIITNGMVSKKKADSLIAAGVDDFLVSRHGLRDTHNFLTDRKGSYDGQLDFLDNIRPFMDFRFNCVINKFNQREIFDIAKEMAVYKPRIINWINMNPHYEWGESDATEDVIADLRIVRPLLEEAIEYLEGNNIGVNVRYYPMCQINEQYRRVICNDIACTFDPYEWDYHIQPKTVEAHYQWGINTSNSIEEKEKPCYGCSLQWICGGVNKNWHKFSRRVHGDGIIVPQLIDIPDENDFYYYRKHNNTTLREK